MDQEISPEIKDELNRKYGSETEDMENDVAKLLTLQPKELQNLIKQSIKTLNKSDCDIRRVYEHIQEYTNPLRHNFSLRGGKMYVELNGLSNMELYMVWWAMEDIGWWENGDIWALLRCE
jgi:hypothetical protein